MNAVLEGWDIASEAKSPHPTVIKLAAGGYVDAV